MTALNGDYRFNYRFGFSDNLGSNSQKAIVAYFTLRGTRRSLSPRKDLNAAITIGALAIAKLRIRANHAAWLLSQAGFVAIIISFLKTYGG